MRHRVAGKKLNRDTAHRKALVKNLVRSLLIHEEIKTTKPKAKMASRRFEKLMTTAKKGTVASNRTLQKWLQDRKLVAKMGQLANQNFKDRTSGFTRIQPLTERRGDNTMVYSLSLVEKSKVEPVKKEVKKTSKKEEKPVSKKEAKKPAKKVEKKETKK